MSTTKTAIRRGALAAIVAVTLAPGLASAHTLTSDGRPATTANGGIWDQGDLRADGVLQDLKIGRRYLVRNGKKLRDYVSGAEYAGNSHNSIVVRWNAFHQHTEADELRYPQELSYFLNEYRVYVKPRTAPARIQTQDELTAWHNGCSGGPNRGRSGNSPPTPPFPPIPPECRWRQVPATNAASYSLRFSGLAPDTKYSVGLTPIWELKPNTPRPSGWYDGHDNYIAYNTSIKVQTAAQPETPPEPEPPEEPETPTEPETPEEPEEPETPTEPETPEEPEEPETPTEPETPGPTSQGCTYEHRLIGVPGTTTNAYNGRVLVSSKIPNATATIRAYQADNGHRIDVLDSDGRAVENISLAPARSVKRFSIEAIRGWHPVIVAHPSKSAMNAATVAMRLREPGGSIEDSYPPGIEHCEPATDTGPVTETGTTAPDLAVRDAQALLWPATLDWRSTVENIGDAPAQRTSVRLYYGERLLATQAVRSELSAGEQWPMSHGISRSGLSTVPRVGTRLRICVDPVPGEPESKRANNCATVTVESN